MSMVKEKRPRMCLRDIRGMHRGRGKEMEKEKEERTVKITLPRKSRAK